VNIHVPAFDRRRFLRTLGQGALLALPGPLWADDADAVTISLLHTTDLHGHILPTTDYSGRPDLGGLARCATQIRQWRAANPNSLLLDIGDVYEGTQLGLHTRGAAMIRCFNALAYDAWVVGNHEFDWGLDALSACVGQSAMPVLSGNAMVSGKAVGSLEGTLGKLRPYLIKEIAGIRIAVVGLTTPGLASWLPPEYLRGFEALDPVEALRPILREVEALNPDAIVVAGHMGLKRRDDEANRVGALTASSPQLVAYLGGHTHQNIPSETIHGVLYTQADHFGIYAGKLDLTFDRTSKKLLHSEAITVQMDHQVAFDPTVLSLTQAEIDAADLVLGQKIGELAEPFDVLTSFGRPSDVERLIASGIVASLRKSGTDVDAVVHGLFDGTAPLAVGAKTVADAWAVLPYENGVVTIDVSRDDLLAIAREIGTASSRDARNLMGLRVTGAAEGKASRVDDLRAADGSSLPAKPVYRIAMNSYDSQSAGGRFPVLAQLVARPTSKRVLHPIQVRDALIDFFVSRGKISRASLLV
jgi:2',3'-cyclic-nucleotide 2'-phosphodiesterase/3'-nucleotidase